ncbi:MAG TPA: hypothetical protein VN437_03280, partial [Rectinemataceae bacterium]|nr:hypothetical protein [Rectinemataceae bacterium]
MKKHNVVPLLMVILFVFGVAFVGAAEPKVRLVLKDLDTDPNGALMIQLIEKGMAAAGTPVDIELVKVPAANYAEKISLM